MVFPQFPLVTVGYNQSPKGSLRMQLRSPCGDRFKPTVTNGNCGYKKKYGALGGCEKIRDGTILILFPPHRENFKTPTLRSITDFYFFDLMKKSLKILQISNFFTASCGD